MKLTPEEIDQMPAGPEMNALIEAEIFGAVPLTDEEFEIFTATYLMSNGPLYASQVVRPMKYPLGYPQFETKLMFRLQWPSGYSSDVFGSSSKVVEKMREDGWLFRLADSDEKGDVLAAFWKGDISSHARADTDALAISRAALKAKLQDEALNKRGEM